MTDKLADALNAWINHLRQYEQREGKDLRIAVDVVATGIKEYLTAHESAKAAAPDDVPNTVCRNCNYDQQVCGDTLCGQIKPEPSATSDDAQAAIDWIDGLGIEIPYKIGLTILKALRNTQTATPDDVREAVVQLRDLDAGYEVTVKDVAAINVLKAAALRQPQVVPREVVDYLKIAIKFGRGTSNTDANVAAGWVEKALALLNAQQGEKQ